MTLLKKILSRLIRKKYLTNLGSEKTFDEKYNELGVFNYNHDGFTINYGNFIKKLDWSDITQINVYKVDSMTIDRIDMEIVYGDKYFTISEDLPGWYQFVLKTKEIFPTIPKDWDVTIMQPAFAKNHRTIYDKEIFKLN